MAGEPTMNGGEALIQVLRRHGVEHIFCSPGSEWHPVWEGLAKLRAQGEASPAYINCRHEGLAVSAASGYTRVSRRPQAVLLHTNVGILNAALFIRAAYHERVPMLICTGEGVTFGEDPNAHDPGRHWLHSLADVDHPAALVAPYVKWQEEVKSAHTLVATMEQALQIAITPPQGPVALSIPYEVLMSPVEASAAQETPVCEVAPAAADDQTLLKVADTLLKARNPLIVTEYAGRETEAVGSLVRLAEFLGCPVMEPVGRGFMNFPTTHPLYLRPDPQLMATADVVFIVGATAPWWPVSRRPAGVSRVIALDSDFPKARLPYPGYPADLAIPAPMGPALARLVDILLASERGEERAIESRTRHVQWQEPHERQRQALERQAQAVRGQAPISPLWLCHTLNRLLPQEAIVFQEVTVHRSLVHDYIERTQPGTFFGRISGGLGVSICNALGIKLAAPGAVSVALVGDGAFHYNPVLACFGLAQEYGLPILVVVFDNQSYASMRLGTQESFPNGWAQRTATFYGSTIAPQPDYVALAGAYGGYGVCVREPQRLESALRQALDEARGGRLALVDVVLSEQGGSRG